MGRDNVYIKSLQTFFFLILYTKNECSVQW